MRMTLILLLLFCAVVLVTADEDVVVEGQSRDLPDELENSGDLERKHRKRKKHGQQGGPCGFQGYGYGKTFGSHDYTYVSAPVMNYFFGCGAMPVAPVQQLYPQPVHGGHGHGHGHGGHGGHGGQGGHGGHVGYGGYGNPGYGGQGFYPQQGFRPGFQNQYQPGFQNGYQPGFNQGYPGQFNRPFQNVFSAAASGLGTALADYITRPRKAQRQINQLLKPLYKLF